MAGITVFSPNSFSFYFGNRQNPTHLGNILVSPWLLENLKPADGYLITSRHWLNFHGSDSYMIQHGVSLTVDIYIKLIQNNYFHWPIDRSTNGNLMRIFSVLVRDIPSQQQRWDQSALYHSVLSEEMFCHWLKSGMSSLVTKTFRGVTLFLS